MLIILLFALVLTLILRSKKPSLFWTPLIVVELIVAGFFVVPQLKPKDLAKPYQSVFRSCGYALGRLLVESGRPSGKVIVLQPGNNRVDEWHQAGLKNAIEGTGFILAGTETIPADIQSGNLNESLFVAALKKHSDIPYVVAFAGLPGSPDKETPQRFVCFHPNSTDGMQAWWKEGRLMGLVAPRAGGAITPNGREKPEDLVNLFFNVRHSGEGL